nr:protein TonB-like [Aegilops tauschii subsp. strangulata]
MGDAIKSGAAPSKPKTTPKQSSQAQAPKPTSPKRSTRNISEKKKAPVPEVQEEEEPQVLRKLKPKIPDHDDNHPIAENMKLRKDAGLRLRRQTDPYATRIRTAVDYRFHTKEQQDFFETILLDKKPIVSNMRWVDWQFIGDNEDYFPEVHESFRMNGVDTFVVQKLTKSNDEME